MEEKSEKLNQVVETSKKTNENLNNQNKNQKEINNKKDSQFMEFPENQEEDYEYFKQEDPNFPEIQEINENMNQLKEDKEIKNKNLEKLDKEVHQTNIISTETKHTTTLFKTTKIEIKSSINFVNSSVILNCPLNLVDILSKNQNISEYQKAYNRIKMLIKEPKIYTFIYGKGKKGRNGKIVCIGAKSEKESKMGCIQCANIIKKCGYNVNIEEKDIKINNIAASCNVNFKINLLELSKKVSDLKYYAFYEPEIFPGLVCRFKNKKGGLFARIFNEGKLNISGAKTEKEINKTFDELYSYLKDARLMSSII